jgi:uncharacterized repeat protein (TIGR01451 family)
MQTERQPAAKTELSNRKRHRHYATPIASVACFALIVWLSANFSKGGAASAWMACGYSILPTSNSYTADSTKETVQVTTSTGCKWQAASNDGWIIITSPVGGGGFDTGPFTLAIQANSGAPNKNTSSRSGTVTVTGSGPPLTTLTFTAVQSGCTFGVASNNPCVPAGGGLNSLTVLTGSATACPWTASSNTSWITILTASGNGDGPVSYAVAPNSGAAARAGTFIAAGQTVTVNQAGTSSCAFPLAPAAQSFPGAGGTGAITVTTPPCSCSWSAISNTSWINIDSGSTGAGNGTVGYSVAANPTNLSRTGSITAAGQGFTVTQSAAGTGGCIYSLIPAESAFDSSGGAGTFLITAPAGCTWTANPGATWITIISAGAGSGNGVIGYSVAPNPGPAVRESTVAIAGQAFTIDQAAPGDQADLSISAITDGTSNPVAAGTRLNYSITVRNAGPNPATGVTVRAATPQGTSFASLSGPGSSTNPGPGFTGPITCFVGTISANTSVTFTVTVNVLAAPGQTLAENASVSSLTADPLPTNNATTLATPIMGGSVVLLSWDQPPSTPADPTPAPANLRIGPAASTAPPQLILENVVTQGSSTCQLLGYNEYLSTSLPIEIIPANLWESFPPANEVPTPVNPNGEFLQLTALWNCGGVITEALLSSNQVTVPAPPTVMGVRVAGKLRASGTGFTDAVDVLMDGVKFSKQSSVRNNNTLIIQKGALIDGRGLLDVLVPGKTVLFSFRNSDGALAHV